MGRISILCVFLVVLGLGPADSAVYDVGRLGAVGDGENDDTEAFMNAWKDACADSSPSVFRVPKGKQFLLQSVFFEGPCRSNITVQVEGDIIASNWKVGKKDGEWIMFKGIDNMVVTGKGTVDGRGDPWWKCKLKGDCDSPPYLFSFMSCNNLSLSGLSFTNSPSKHVTVYGCSDVVVSNISIKSPDKSPNTDGFLISMSQHVTLMESHIATGDDCVAIINGSVDINITKVDCGPGHGISIGSLGRESSLGMVEDVIISYCNFLMTQNGARIKTWQGGQGYVKNVKFSNLRFTDILNPIIINQFYCPDGNCKNHSSAVKISDVSFEQVKGTAMQAETIRLACSETVPCQGITMRNVDVWSKDEPSVSYCLSVHGSAEGKMYPPVPCLK